VLGPRGREQPGREGRVDIELVARAVDHDRRDRAESQPVEERRVVFGRQQLERQLTLLRPQGFHIEPNRARQVVLQVAGPRLADVHENRDRSSRGAGRRLRPRDPVRQLLGADEARGLGCHPGR